MTALKTGMRPDGGLKLGMRPDAADAQDRDASGRVPEARYAPDALTLKTGMRPDACAEARHAPRRRGFLTSACSDTASPAPARSRASAPEQGAARTYTFQKHVTRIATPGGPDGQPSRALGAAAAPRGRDAQRDRRLGARPQDPRATAHRRPGEAVRPSDHRDVRCRQGLPRHCPRGGLRAPHRARRRPPLSRLLHRRADSGTCRTWRTSACTPS